MQRFIETKYSGDDGRAEATMSSNLVAPTPSTMSVRKATRVVQVRVATSDGTMSFAIRPFVIEQEDRQERLNGGALGRESIFGTTVD